MLPAKVSATWHPLGHLQENSVVKTVLTPGPNEDVGLPLPGKK